jgi:hypothetical protein
MVLVVTWRSYMRMKKKFFIRIDILICTHIPCVIPGEDVPTKPRYLSSLSHGSQSPLDSQSSLYRSIASAGTKKIPWMHCRDALTLIVYFGESNFTHEVS